MTSTMPHATKASLALSPTARLQIDIFTAIISRSLFPWAASAKLIGISALVDSLNGAVEKETLPHHSFTNTWPHRRHPPIVSGIEGNISTQGHRATGASELVGRRNDIKLK